MAELLSFISADLIKPLARQLGQIWERRSGALAELADTFGDPRPLAACYVEPRVQHHNPADHDEDDAQRSYVRSPAFESINHFLRGDSPLRDDGRRQLFLLADAGMGKTSLLLMLRLSHLLAFWPKTYGCTLLKLGNDTLERIEKHPDKGNTVLLLDALDEDPAAWGRIGERLKDLLQATAPFRRVILSCRTQFFPEAGVDPFGNPGMVVVGGFRCPMLFLSLFDDDQVERYLARRFPDRWADRFLMRPNPLRERAAELVGSMRSLKFRPLLLAHVEDLIGPGVAMVPANADAPEPQAPAERNGCLSYRLYESLVRAWLLREERKLARQLAEPPTMEALLDVCTLIAVRLQASGARSLTREGLETLKARHPAVRHLDDLDVGGRSLLNRNAAGEYRFSHYSIQEFLTVRAISTGALDLEKGRIALQAPGRSFSLELFAPGGRLRLTDQMLEFLAGTEIVLDAARVDLSGVRPEGLVGLAIRDRLADGTPAPLMQLIPAGGFLMGSAESDPQSFPDEGPQHEVTLAHPFWIGRYPVTFAEYDRFCDATGRQRPHDQGWGRLDRPVINVSWEDAVAYCDWLSAQTGQRYRLPTEAEWEYAARAGSRTRWSFGDRERDLGEHGWYRENSEWQTRPVGQKRPNAWGLYDCHGNVWEWVRDQWHADYRLAPNDGSAWAEMQPGAGRVVRGGSWSGVARYCRCAYRSQIEPGLRYGFLGFRCARDQAG